MKFDNRREIPNMIDQARCRPQSLRVRRAIGVRQGLDRRAPAFLGFVALLAFATAPARAADPDLLVGVGETLILSPGEHAYDDVRIDGKLRLTGDTIFEARTLWLQGQIEISGDTTILVTYALVDPDGTEPAFHIGDPEVYRSTRIVSDFNLDPNDGLNLRATDGVSGAVPGGNGTPGADGADGYDLNIYVHGDMVVDGPSEIRLRGQDGGKGGGGGEGSRATANCGSGGAAGTSAPGGRGGDGGNMNVVITRSITTTGNGFHGGLDWDAGGGAGGEGGGGAVGGGARGGKITDGVCECSDGNGGDGGSGALAGEGGDGGTIFVSATRIDANSSSGHELSARGGYANKSGDGAPGGGIAFSVGEPCVRGHRGQSGDGTQGSPAGNGGWVTIETSCVLAPGRGMTIDVSGALGGPGGAPGRVGSGRGLDAPDNVTGVGGNGGDIAILSASAAMLTLSSKGGEGGRGSHGGDSGPGFCVDGNSGGDAGNGAPGGDGGFVSIVSEEVDDARVSADISGAQGGLGGTWGSGGGSPCPPGVAGEAGVAGVDGIDSREQRACGCLDSCATISGTILDEQCVAPPAGERVAVAVLRDGACDGVLVAFDWASTDDGEYTVGGLAAGTYYVRTVSVGAAYADEWWSAQASAPGCEDAQAISLTANQAVRDKDFQLGDGAAIACCTPACDAVCETCMARACEPLCGAPQTRGEEPTAVDALAVLKAAVGSADCEACLCDVNDSGGITASDALRVLRRAVGQDIALVCPAA